MHLCLAHVPNLGIWSKVMLFSESQFFFTPCTQIGNLLCLYLELYHRKSSWLELNLHVLHLRQCRSGVCCRFLPQSKTAGNILRHKSIKEQVKIGILISKKKLFIWNLEEDFPILKVGILVYLPNFFCYS